MYFTPELDTVEIPKILVKFKSIIGWKNLNKKFSLLSDCKDNNTTMDYLEKRFSLELSLKEIFDYKKNTNRVLWGPNKSQLEAYSFMAMVVKIHNRLSNFGKKVFRKA